MDFFFNMSSGCKIMIIKPIIRQLCMGEIERQKKMNTMSVFCTTSTLP